MSRQSIYWWRITIAGWPEAGPGLQKGRCGVPQRPFALGRFRQPFVVVVVVVDGAVVPGVVAAGA